MTTPRTPWPTEVYKDDSTGPARDPMPGDRRLATKAAYKRTLRARWRAEGRKVT